MLKKHWPVLFSFIAILVSIILAAVAYHSTDTGYAILTSVVTFMFLFPLACVLIGAWYGWRLRSWKKWLIPPAVYGCVVLYMVLAGLILGVDLFDAESCLTLGALPALSCLAAEIAASVIAWAVNRARNKG